MKAVIIEDEALIARELQHKITEVAADIRLIEILPSLKTAYKWFMENPEPDLLFADIQLSDGISFEIFNRFDLKCPVIFTTAYDEYAIKAFKVNGVDYLLKPIDTQDLKKAIDKCRLIIQNKSQYPKDIQQLLQMMSQPNAAGPGYKEKFVVKIRNQWLPVPTKDIACFFRENLNYLFTYNGDKHILDFTTLDEVEELLDPRIYYRANRQAIIHIDSIQSVRPQENQKLVVTLKAPLKMELDISREKAPGFKKWFDR